MEVYECIKPVVCLEGLNRQVKALKSNWYVYYLPNEQTPLGNGHRL